MLVLATSNSGEVIHWSDMAWPLATASAVAAFGTALGIVVSRDPHATGLVALLTVLVFSWYGYVAGGLYIHFEGHPAKRWEPLLFGALVASPPALAVLLRRRAISPVVSRWLTATFSLLLVYNGALLGVDLLGTVPPTPAVKPVSLLSAPPERLPDIYLIVPDKYTGSAVLQAHYGYDNSRMVAALEERGFVVPARAQANYVQTFLALAAMLYLDYLNHYRERFGPDGLPEDAFSDVEYNRMVKLLRAHGYRFVFLPTAFGATRQNRDADVQLPEPSSIQPEFLLAWRRTTMLPFLHRVSCAVLGCVVDPSDYVPETAALIDWKFHELERVASAERPTFVFAHLMVPHEPYMYGPECEHLRPFWPANDSDAEWPRIRLAYLQQIECVNHKLLRLVDRLQANARVPPVILIQSDHGHGRLGRKWPHLQDVSPTQVAERFSVFAAYAIPELAESVPDTITPVNAIRLALRNALGADLPALPERRYWSTVQRPYDFTPVE